MTFSDEQSPAPPFYGDETGEVLDPPPPDIVWQSPTTNERVVDTQSGFLVVIREIGNRLALSVKRRLGTPPTSSVLLTPDECVSLSRILSNPKGTTDSVLEGRLYQRVSEGANSSTEDPAFEPPNLSDTVANQLSKDKSLSLRTAKWEKLLGYESDRKSKVARLVHIGLILCMLVLFIVMNAVFYHLKHSDKLAMATQSTPGTTAQLSPVDTENFARAYVAHLLDFNPTTYRYSQIQAMSFMSPDLLQKYWEQTHFPISTDRLQQLFHGQKVAIAKVTIEEPTTDSTTIADVFGQVADSKTDPRKSVPIHLRLKIAGDQNELTVVEQTDLSNENQNGN